MGNARGSSDRGSGDRGGDAVRAWRRLRLGDTVLTTAAAAAAVGAFLVSVSAGGADGTRRTVLVAAGAVLTGLGIVLAAAQRRRSDRALHTAEQIAFDAEVGLTLTLNGALAPITSYLGELAATADRAARAAIAGQLRQAVVDAAVTLTVSGSRSAFYVQDPAGGRLVRAVYAGRSTLPRERFERGTPDGDFVLELVANGDLLFIDDVSAHPVITPSTPGYAAVIAVAVTAGPRRFGMLTVDAPQVGQFTQTDVELVRVLANLLGSGQAGQLPP
jgi:putative methionine-R-sulfoxide reductase with GAF domain